jgi:hypothetical protein
MAPVAAVAQQKVNSIHGSPFATLAAQSKTSEIPQLAGKWDILSTDAGGDQYNSSGGTYLGPIEFTADFAQRNSSLVEVHGFTFTSSACSADGTASVSGTIDPSGGSGNANANTIRTPRVRSAAPGQPMVGLVASRVGNSRHISTINSPIVPSSESLPRM